MVAQGIIREKNGNENKKKWTHIYISTNHQKKRSSIGKIMIKSFEMRSMITSILGTVTKKMV